MPGQPTRKSELRRQFHRRQLLADLERESSWRRQSQAPVSPDSLARQSEAETANDWPSQDIENILSGEISVPDDVLEVSGSSSSERGISQGGGFRYPLPGIYCRRGQVRGTFSPP